LNLLIAATEVLLSGSFLYTLCGLGSFFKKNRMKEKKNILIYVILVKDSKDERGKLGWIALREKLLVDPDESLQR